MFAKDYGAYRSVIKFRVTMAEQRIIAIVNQKGGVGKTTTTINMAAALTLRNQRVLLIDLDPQGNAATGLGISKSTCKNTIYDVFIDDTPISSAVIGTIVPGLDIVPSHIDLSGAELQIGNRQGRTTILRNAIKGMEYDYILIDCPPSLNLLTINALAAAKSVLVPLQCEFFLLLFRKFPLFQLIFFCLHKLLIQLYDSPYLVISLYHLKKYQNFEVL